MPDIASVLKEEITRLARKEVIRQTKELRSSITAHRSQLAALRRKNEELEKQLKRLARGKAHSQPSPSTSGDTSDERHRFSAKGLATHRQRLGLSAADFGALIGASSLSVYKWEKGEVRPREKYLAAIATVRKLGKREASARLATLR